MGPSHGVRVIELESLAPAPFGCMVLADLGADVLRVDRPGGAGRIGGAAYRPLVRGRRSIRPTSRTRPAWPCCCAWWRPRTCWSRGTGPGVAERLGCGPEVCVDRNPRLVYARMTGWGQDGPLAAAAGHDIDYIAVAGILDPIGRAGSGRGRR